MAALLLLCLLAVFIGCGELVGIDYRRVDPSLYDASAANPPTTEAGTGDADAAETLAPTCALEGVGDSSIRLLHAHPSSAVIDLCWKPAGDSSWTPLLRSLPEGCPQGLHYAQATVAVPVPSGPTELRVVDGADCESFLVETTAVLEPGRRQTLAYAEQPDGEALLHVSSEYDHRASVGPRRVRVLDLLACTAPIDVGIADDDRVGAKLHAVVGKGLTFGSSPPKDEGGTIGPIDADGYLITDNFGLFFGAADEGESSCFAATEVAGSSSALTASMFVVGKPSAWQYPRQFLKCNENEGDGVLARCELSLGEQKSQITVGVFAAELVGAYSPREAERRAFIADEIASLKTDVLCVTEVARQEDREAIIEAAEKTGFKYVALPQSDRNTPFTDATDSSGAVPEPDDDPPCAPEPPVEGLTDAFDALMECAMDECSSIAGSEDGHVVEIDCVTKMCFSTILSLMGGGREEQRCLSCLQGGVNDFSSFKDIRTRCTSDVQGGWTFDGHSYTLLLSRHPLKEESIQTFVLPSTLVRRSVIRATVEFGPGIDLYCSHLGDTYGSIVVYAGQYGDGQSSTKAWANEQLLQANKLCSYVSSESAKRPAIIAGMMNASRERKNDDGAVLVLDNAGAPSLAALEQCFVPGTTPGYVPACTECAVNPLSEDEAPGYWTSHIFLSGLDASVVKSTERFFLTPQVVVAVDGGTDKIPLSTSYGLQSTISLEDLP